MKGGIIGWETHRNRVLKEEKEKIQMKRNKWPKDRQEVKQRSSHWWWKKVSNDCEKKKTADGDEKKRQRGWKKSTILSVQKKSCVGEDRNWWWEENKRRNHQKRMRKDEEEEVSRGKKKSGDSREDVNERKGIYFSHMKIREERIEKEFLETSWGLHLFVLEPSEDYSGMIRGGEEHSSHDQLIFTWLHTFLLRSGSGILTNWSGSALMGITSDLFKSEDEDDPLMMILWWGSTIIFFTYDEMMSCLFFSIYGWMSPIIVLESVSKYWVSLR